MKELKNILFICLLVCYVSAFGTEPDQQTNYAKMVDTRIGTEGDGLGCGYTFAGATYPFGMVQFTPSFFSPHKGFVINQYSGAGCAHLGNFPVLPQMGELSKSPNEMNDFPQYKTINEAYAGYFSATMADGVVCNTTASERSGIAEFIFPEGQATGSIMIGSGISSTFVTNAQVKVTSSNTCEGFAEGGDFCGSKTGYRVYFVAEFNRSASKVGTWTKNDMRHKRLSISGEKSGAYFIFDLKNDNKIEYKIAISYVSISNAKENLKKDNADRKFITVKNDTEKRWNEHLSKIQVESSNKDRLKQFYTNWYHTLLHPSIFSDINGEYIGGDFNIHKVETGRNYYSGFSGWDTYRTQCQILAMVYPKESSDMMQSATNFAEQSGGFGRWVMANIETGIMHGDPMPIIISNSFAFGAQNFDINKAFKYMQLGANDVGTRSQEQVVRPGLQNYLDNGFENASLCLEYTSTDYAIAQFAQQALNNKEQFDYYTKRSSNWKNLYDTSTKWLRSRHSHDLSWKKPDDDWREATKENYWYRRLGRCII